MDSLLQQTQLAIEELKFTSGALTKHSNEECIRIRAQKSLTVGSVRHANAEVKVYAYSMSPVTVKGKRLKE